MPNSLHTLPFLSLSSSMATTKTPNHALQRTPGFGVQLPGAGCGPTGSVTGCAACHEARHSPRLRLAPACSQPRSRPGVAELGVVRRFLARPMNVSPQYSLYL